MTMYSFKTFKSTYYFPKLNKQNRFIYSLYGNYGGRAAHAIWWLFLHSHTFRLINQSKVSDIEGYHQIQKLLTHPCTFGINMGSAGPDQKKSILGYDHETKVPFFAKLSTKERAMELSRNEIKVYQTLADTGLVPKLFDHKDEESYVFLKCECIKGNHIHYQIDNKIILDILLTLKQKHYTNPPKGSELVTCFAHMDFCPWNMIDVDGSIRVIDWEMAAEMPLGFDLFTYLLQPHFLMEDNLPGKSIITNNESLINEYFGWDKERWMPYLIEFLRWKIQFFSLGQNDHLLLRFNQTLSDFQQ